MYVARILYPVEVLGPGKRIGIWFCGCPHGCKGCCNPELWEFQENYATSLSTLMDLIQKISKNHSVDGFTITGGEPFFQGDDLLLLTEHCSMINKDILVYTGYLLEEIPKKYFENIAVLIDGRYREAENECLPLRGSKNQNIHYLKLEFEEKYQIYLNSTENQVQVFNTSNGFLSVGIHRPHFKEDLEQLMKEKGVE